MAELGALTLRIQEEGAGAVLRELAALESQARLTGGKVEAGFKGAGVALRAFDKEIAASTNLFALQARTADATNKQIVAQIRQNAAAQLQWMQQVGASEAQQLKFAAAVQTFERRVEGATRAQAALGHQTARTTQQMRIFGRDGRSAMIGLGFAISSMASTGEASLLSLARQITTITALMGGKLGAAGIGGAIGIGIFDFFRSRARTQGEILRDAATSTARDVSSIQKAAIQQDEAAQRLAFDRGLTTLRAFYDQRSGIIQRGVAAEIAAKQAEIRALSAPIAGESKKDTADRLSALRKAGAEIVALRSQETAQQIDNAAALEAAERQRNETVTGFESQRLEASGDAHSARLRQIDLEADALRRALGPATDTDARVKRFTDAMVLQAGLAKSQADLERLQTDLSTKRLEVQNKLADNKISEEEAAREIATIERAAVPDLQTMVDLAIRFAAALGDEGALASLRQLSVELKGLGVNITALERSLTNSIREGGPSLREAARKALALVAGQEGPITFEIKAKVAALLDAGSAADAEFSQLGTQLGMTLTDSIAAAAAGGSGAKALLAGLGGIFQEMGKALTIYGLTMMGLLPTFSNPLTAGPAALAAGVALTALGAALGGAASGNKGGSAGGGFSATASSTPLSVSRLIVDPNAGVRQRINSAGMQSAAAAAPHPLDGVALFRTDTPAGAAYFAKRVEAYQRRGG